MWTHILLLVAGVDLFIAACIHFPVVKVKHIALSVSVLPVDRQIETRPSANSCSLCWELLLYMSQL